MISKKLIILLVSLFLFFSCASKKKILEINKSKINKESIVSIDSIYKEDNNSQISDSFFVSLLTGNKVADSIVNQKLQNFKTEKSSGVNSYSAKYDSIKKGLRIKTKVGATKNIETKLKEKGVEKQLIVSNVNKEKEVIRTSIFYKYLFFLSVFISIGLFIKFKFF